MSMASSQQLFPFSTALPTRALAPIRPATIAVALLPGPEPAARPAAPALSSAKAPRRASFQPRLGRTVDERLSRFPRAGGSLHCHRISRSKRLAISFDAAQHERDCSGPRQRTRQQAGTRFADGGEHSPRLPGRVGAAHVVSLPGRVHLPVMGCNYRAAVSCPSPPSIRARQAGAEQPGAWVNEWPSVRDGFKHRREAPFGAERLRKARRAQAMQQFWPAVPPHARRPPGKGSARASHRPRAIGPPAEAERFCGQWDASRRPLTPSRRSGRSGRPSRQRPPQARAGSAREWESALGASAATSRKQMAEAGARFTTAPRRGDRGEGVLKPLLDRHSALRRGANSAAAASRPMAIQAGRPSKPIGGAQPSARHRAPPRCTGQAALSRQAAGLLRCGG